MRSAPNWSEEEDAKLVRLMIQTDLTEEQIAAELDRGVRGTVVRWHKLRKRAGLPNRSEIKTKALKGNLKINLLPSPAASAAARDPIPDEALFNFLKDKPQRVEDICRRFDCGPDTVERRLEQIEKEGWVLQRYDDERVLVNTKTPPLITSLDAPPLAETYGMNVTIAVGSDVHAGSVWSQPTALRQFTVEAYERYGVRDFFNPGDCTDGIFGHRVSDLELVPNARPFTRNQSRPASVVQAQLYELYKVQRPGLRYFELGGNHDMWHIAANGFDPVKYVCDQREDMEYCGYTDASIPLTDKVMIRMWHPNRGPAYAKSYPLQKKMESEAFKDLQDAVYLNDAPKSSVILVGHLHYSFLLLDLPMIGVMAGSFQAQTKYEAGKALVPNLGGTILRFWLKDDGYIDRVTYEFLHYEPIENDWRNYPVPEQEIDYDTSKISMKTLYKFVPEPISEHLPWRDSDRQQSDSRPA